MGSHIPISHWQICSSLGDSVITEPLDHFSRASWHCLCSYASCHISGVTKKRKQEFWSDLHKCWSAITCYFDTNLSNCSWYISASESLGDNVKKGKSHVPHKRFWFSKSEAGPGICSCNKNLECFCCVWYIDHTFGNVSLAQWFWNLNVYQKRMMCLKHLMCLLKHWLIGSPAPCISNSVSALEPKNLHFFFFYLFIQLIFFK